MDHLKWKNLGQSTSEPTRRKPIVKTYLMPDGKRSEYEIIPGNGACCVLALTPENDVVLAAQYRPGPDKLMLELPGGYVDPEDESNVAAAQRELLEETGYTGDFEYVATSYKDGYSQIATHSFVATNCQKVSEPTPDSNEFIEIVKMPLNQSRAEKWRNDIKVRTMPLDEFRTHIKTDSLTDALTAYLGLDYLGLL